MRCLEKVLKMCFYFDTCFFMTSSAGICAVVILKDGESGSGEETAQTESEAVGETPLLSLSLLWYVRCTCIYLKLHGRSNVPVVTVNTLQ